jgi:nitrate/nitrite-specific signal transduction histidine kinase
VRDDGKGFAPERQPKPGTGMALMRERAEAANGRFWIESAPGNGTTLRVAVQGSEVVEPKAGTGGLSIPPYLDKGVHA